MPPNLVPDFSKIGNQISISATYIDPNLVPDFRNFGAEKAALNQVPEVEHLPRVVLDGHGPNLPVNNVVGVNVDRIAVSDPENGRLLRQSHRRCEPARERLAF